MSEYRDVGITRWTRYPVPLPVLSNSLLVACAILYTLSVVVRLLAVLQTLISAWHFFFYKQLHFCELQNLLNYKNNIWSMIFIKDAGPNVIISLLGFYFWYSNIFSACNSFSYHIHIVPVGPVFSHIFIYSYIYHQSNYRFTITISFIAFNSGSSSSLIG